MKNGIHRVIFVLALAVMLVPAGPRSINRTDEVEQLRFSQARS